MENNQKNITPKNWRAWKRGKMWVVGCSLLIGLSLVGGTMAPVKAQEGVIATTEELGSTENDQSNGVAQSLEAVEASENIETEVNGEDALKTEEVEEETIYASEVVSHVENEMEKPQPATGGFFRNGANVTPHGQVRTLKGRYNFDITNTGPLPRRENSGDVGFVKVSDYEWVYLYSFGDSTPLSAQDLRDRVVVTPLSGINEPSFRGVDTANFRVEGTEHNQVFKDAYGRNVDALYVVSIDYRNRFNLSYSTNFVGTATNGDGGGNFTGITGSQISYGSQATLDSQHKLVRGAQYAFSVYVSNRVQSGTNNPTSFSIYVLAVDNKAPVVNEAETSDRIRQSLGGEALTKDNIDRVLTMDNVDVKDNVTPSSALKNGNTEIILSDGRREYTVAELKSLLSGSNSNEYANNTYSITIRSTDAAGYQGSSAPISMDVIDKQPLNEKKQQSDLVETPEPPANTAPISIRAYEVARQEFEQARREAERVLASTNPSAQELKNAIDRLNQATSNIETAKQYLVPSLASRFAPNQPEIERSVTNLAILDELIRLVNVPGTTDYTVTLDNTVLPTDINTHNLTVTVRYADESIDKTTIRYIIHPDIEGARRAVAEAERLANELDRSIVSSGPAITQDEHDALARKRQEVETAKDVARQAISTIPGRYAENAQLTNQLNQVRVSDVPVVNDENDNGVEDTQDIENARQAVEAAKQAQEALDEAIAQANPAISASERDALEKQKEAVEGLKEAARRAIDAIPASKGEKGQFTNEVSQLPTSTIPDVNDENDNGRTDAEDVRLAQEALEKAKALSEEILVTLERAKHISLTPEEQVILQAQINSYLVAKLFAESLLQQVPNTERNSILVQQYEQLPNLSGNTIVEVNMNNNKTRKYEAKVNQPMLPNTGTSSELWEISGSIASLLLGMGLLKKRKDEEEAE